ncbi:histidine phosphotransferase, partial [Pilatotrama ljubarskyi]
DQENIIDLDTFNQILDLDEDDTHDFSLGMAEAYFTQASNTFVDMDEAFAKKDLTKLSSLGHFLKGSSAALGVSAVQASCEHIQHYGALRDEETGTDLTPEDALAKIGPLLKRVKREYAVAEKWLKNWYKEHAIPAEV